MIGAMAEAGAVAARAVDDRVGGARARVRRREARDVRSRRTKTARALRLVKGDVVKGPGFLDDHAYLANAALDLYEVTGDPRAWRSLVRSSTA